MTGHGWVWPIDENGDPTGAPIEMRDVKLLSATREGGIAFDGEWILDPHGAPLDLEGGTAPNQYSELFEGDDVMIFDGERFRTLDP